MGLDAMFMACASLPVCAAATAAVNAGSTHAAHKVFRAHAEFPRSYHLAALLRHRGPGFLCFHVRICQTCSTAPALSHEARADLFAKALFVKQKSGVPTQRERTWKFRYISK